MANMSTREQRLARQDVLRDVSAAQHAVVSRRQLYHAGITRWQVRAELRARRWRQHGRQTVALHTGPLDRTAVMWRAVFETGADSALDGVSALMMRGLEHFETDVVHVSVSKGTRYCRSRGVRIHETRRRRPSDMPEASAPVVRADVATLRAALWAATDRQAAFVIVLAVQQGLTTPGALFESFASIRRDKRRTLIKRLLEDVAGGVQSMGELDFARACRRRGLPPPTRQALRRMPNGRAYLDVYWDQFRIVVEIEGFHHLLPGVAIADSLRQNQLTLDRDRVLRIPVLDQVEELLRRHGWQGPPRPHDNPLAS